MEHFGVPVRILGMPPDVVILGGVGTLFYGVILFGFAGCLSVMADRLDAEYLHRGNRRYDAIVGGVGVGTIFVLLWVLPLFIASDGIWWRPLAILVLLHLLWGRGVASSSMPASGESKKWVTRGLWILILIWWIGVFASHRGLEWAKSVTAEPGQLPAVSISSASPLGISCEGVSAEGERQPQYRYSGLYLLNASADKIVVLELCSAGPVARILPFANISVAVEEPR